MIFPVTMGKMMASRESRRREYLQNACLLDMTELDPSEWTEDMVLVFYKNYSDAFDSVSHVRERFLAYQSRHGVSVPVDECGFLSSCVSENGV